MCVLSIKVPIRKKVWKLIVCSYKGIFKCKRVRPHLMDPYAFILPTNILFTPRGFYGPLLEALDNTIHQQLVQEILNNWMFLWMNTISVWKSIKPYSCWPSTLPTRRFLSENFIDSRSSVVSGTRIKTWFLYRNICVLWWGEIMKHF